MQAETEWSRRFKCKDTPVVYFICHFPPPNQVCNLHRYTLTLNSVGKVFKAITGFLSGTPCCCTVSGLRFSIVILSSFLIVLLHTDSPAVQTPFSWPTIVALSLSLSRSLSLYASLCLSPHPHKHTHKYLCCTKEADAVSIICSEN